MGFLCGTRGGGSLCTLPAELLQALNQGGEVSSSQVDITGHVDEHGFIVLRVSYDSQHMLRRDASESLRAYMTQWYQEISKKSKHKTCLVIIDAEVAGSPLVRALFELYVTVTREGGELVCAGYPEDYIDSLTTLGLTHLSGFALVASEEQGLIYLRAEYPIQHDQS